MRASSRTYITVTAILLLLAALAGAQAAPPPDEPMTIEKVKEGLYFVRGPFSACGPAGCRGPAPQALADGLPHEAGDVAVRVTSDGVILVDTKYPWHVDELLEKSAASRRNRSSMF
jgi:hypothetical protein